MNKPHLYDFYSFGAHMHSASRVVAGHLQGNFDAIEPLSTTEIACAVFSMSEFNQTYLPTAAQRAKDFGVYISRSFLRRPEDVGGGVAPDIYDQDVAEIKRYLLAFETSLEDELSRLPVFLCEDTDVGNLSIDKLLKSASNGYPKYTRDHLTDVCRQEIDEAGRCLAYKRSTAAAFHILRSVELTIRDYLIKIPGFVMPALNRQNWGEYLKLLKDNGAVREVTDHLHNIKDNYRNPVMHPEDTLDMEEASSLFGVAQSMNEMLVRDMKKRGFIQ